jgi:hypothetical protein
VKRGEQPYDAVGEEIERLLEAVEAAASSSALRDEPTGISSTISEVTVAGMGKPDPELGAPTQIGVFRCR